jgi:CPA2 family monovalent cation:H+ antiporter-2
MVKQARGLNPNLHIMVRTRYLKELQELHDLGANEVIPEEFETSIEIFTLVLKTYQVPQPVILQKAEHIRREGYALLRRGELPELAHHLRGGTLADVDVETCRIEEDSPPLGKSLGEVGIHRRTGSSIVAITRNGVTQSNPPMNLVLDVGDVLVILGSREQIRRARALLFDKKTIDS